jgi:hypothetical protein
MHGKFESQMEWVWTTAWHLTTQPPCLLTSTGGDWTLGRKTAEAGGDTLGGDRGDKLGGDWTLREGADDATLC